MPARLRRKQVSGDEYFDPRPDSEVRGGGYAFPTPVPSNAGPTATPAPGEFYENRFGVFENTPSATIFPYGPDYAGFRGDEFYSGDFEADASGSASIAPGLRLAGEANATLAPRPVGQPTVELPTSTTPSFQSAGTLDAEPSLFPSATNPFDEWWRTAETTPTITVNAGDGGGIWSGDTTLQDFGGDLSLGEDMNASLTDLGLGSGYPEVAADIPGTPFIPTPEGTGIPIEPEILPQDYEWTTSPDDRRFLPGNEPAPETASTGGDLSSFGTFGSPFTLGQVFNTPLASLRYGEGYPAVEAGDTFTPTGATTNWNSVRQQWERWNPSTGQLDVIGGIPPPSDTSPDTSIHDNATSSPYPAPGTEEDWSSNAGPRPTEGFGEIPIPVLGEMYNYGGINPGTPSYGLSGQYGSTWNVPATARNAGGINPASGRSFQSQESARMMDAVSMWGFAPSYVRPDMPSSFSVGGMRLDSEGGFEQVSSGRVGGRLTTAADRARARQLTTAQGRAAAGRGG